MRWLQARYRKYTSTANQGSGLLLRHLRVLNAGLHWVSSLYKGVACSVYQLTTSLGPAGHPHHHGSSAVQSGSSAFSVIIDGDERHMPASRGCGFLLPLMTQTVERILIINTFFFQLNLQANQTLTFDNLDDSTYVVRALG